MASSALTPSSAPTTSPITPISLKEIAPWAVLVGLLLLALLYFVGAEQGATSLISGENVHEWVHDGRHLLGFPCH
ncbi:CbtB-domain containing protein [Streptomyces sp. NPDC021100]|uniref:CbtB domain-containing protein n=1 Tax=Streptomyces sp. NPDC021100 TaxID=3365114 RepID=UPI0037945606